MEQFKVCSKEKYVLNASFTQLQGLWHEQSKNTSFCNNQLQQQIVNNTICQEEVKKLTVNVTSSGMGNESMVEQFKVCSKEKKDLNASFTQLQGLWHEQSKNTSFCNNQLQQQMFNNTICQEEVKKLTVSITSSGMVNESMVEQFKVCSKEKYVLNASLTKLENTSFHCKKDLNDTLDWYNDCNKSLVKVREIVLDTKSKPKRKRQTHNEIQLENIQLKKNLTICIHRSYKLSMSLESEKVLFHQEMKKLNESLIYLKGNCISLP